MGDEKKAVHVTRAKECGNTLPPVAANVDNSKEKKVPTQTQCRGLRLYSEVAVATYNFEGQTSSTAKNDAANSGSDSVQKQEKSIVNVPSSSSLRPKFALGDSCDMDSISFFSGNPFIEKTKGILHFYKHSDPDCSDLEGCTLIGMLSVPSMMSCNELLRFISPHSEHIKTMKIVRDSTPNQYMAVIKFHSHDNAFQKEAARFYREYNGTSYSSFIPETCTLVFVERVETIGEEDGGCLPVEAHTELPTCPVCLERMDEGVLTILCNHTFHAACLEKWSDLTCPVCRHMQTPDVEKQQRCSVCEQTTDLWICIICGNIGCGRYAEAHAYRHFEETNHTFTMEVGGECVWDYAGDNYVHRLIQNAADGKAVEYQRNEGGEMSKVNSEKMDRMEMEFTCLLTSQLENQRTYFEMKLAEKEKQFQKARDSQQEKMKNLQNEMERLSAENGELKKDVEKMTMQRATAEKKHQTVQEKLNKALLELNDEKALNDVLRNSQNEWKSKVTTLEEDRILMKKNYDAKIEEMNEQLRDLMMHFEAQNKLQEALRTNQVTEQEVNESAVTVAEAQPTPHQGRKKKKKK